MAQSPIKIDTSVQGLKRGHPHDMDSEEDGESPSLGASGGDEAFAIEPSAIESSSDLPAFLSPSIGELHRKFEDLEWLQRTRIQEGITANDLSHKWALETHPEVKARNRYLNVQAWANSRIHLRVPPGVCDFINASPISLEDSRTKHETKYIATQGPKEGHLAHFWHMVFHETKDIAVVVMLTQTFESGREKCAQYFPTDLEDPTMEFEVEVTDPFVEDSSESTVNEDLKGKITLLESKFDKLCRSEIRKFELTIGSESKTVWHYLFAGWADYSKPVGEEREALLQLIKETASKTTPDNPRIVHCSAGVGRTGTFIALDHLLRELESGELLRLEDPEDDPIFNTVNQLREQRMMMVFNEMQLHFIYEVLAEQARLRLGGQQPEGDESTLRSPKIARLSSDVQFEPATKPELEPAPSVTVTAPHASWPGASELSDNE